MHPENEPPMYTSCKACAEKDSGLRYVPEWERFDCEQSSPWWTREYLAAGRKKRVRRVVGNVLAFALTFTALTALWLVVNLIDI